MKKILLLVSTIATTQPLSAEKITGPDGGSMQGLAIDKIVGAMIGTADIVN